MYEMKSNKNIIHKYYPQKTVLFQDSLL